MSGRFAVYDTKKDCLNGQSCFTNASSSKDRPRHRSPPTVRTGSPLKAGAFGVPPAVVGGPGNLSNLDCPGYNEITEVITSFDFDGAGLKTVVDVVSAAQMKEVANQGVSKLQACFGSSLPFTDRNGNPAVFNTTLGLFVGLMKDCPTNREKHVASSLLLSSRGREAGRGHGPVHLCRG